MDDRHAAMACLIDHCQSAREIANARGEKFLSYLLAMTLLAAEETQNARERASARPVEASAIHDGDATTIPTD